MRWERGCPNVFEAATRDVHDIPTLHGVCLEILSWRISFDPDKHLCIGRSFLDAFLYISQWWCALGDPFFLVVCQYYLTLTFEKYQKVVFLYGFFHVADGQNTSILTYFNVQRVSRKNFFLMGFSIYLMDKKRQSPLSWWPKHQARVFRACFGLFFLMDMLSWCLSTWCFMAINVDIFLCLWSTNKGLIVVSLIFMSIFTIDIIFGVTCLLTWSFRRRNIFIEYKIFLDYNTSLAGFDNCSHLLFMASKGWHLFKWLSFL